MEIRRVPMSYHEYSVLPFHPGWKGELWKGVAVFQPREAVAYGTIAVARRQAHGAFPLRSVGLEDEAGIGRGFDAVFETKRGSLIAEKERWEREVARLEQLHGRRRHGGRICEPSRFPIAVAGSRRIPTKTRRMLAVVCVPVYQAHPGPSKKRISITI